MYIIKGIQSDILQSLTKGLWKVNVITRCTDRQKNRVSKSNNQKWVIFKMVSANQENRQNICFFVIYKRRTIIFLSYLIFLWSMHLFQPKYLVHGIKNRCQQWTILVPDILLKVTNIKLYVSILLIHFIYFIYITSFSKK